ncbi:MAG: hypothetical protein ACE5PV_06275 [Candidatus Poribacteria bacterium]
MQELEADSLFQVLIKLFYAVFGIEDLSQIKTELKEFCQWLVTETEELTIEEQVAYRTLIITYNILKDEEMKKQMGRKIWKPDYDSLAGYLREDMPPEIKIKFIQSFLHTDSPEMIVQRILGVDSPEEGVRKLLGVDSLDEAILKLVRAKEQQEEKNAE